MKWILPFFIMTIAVMSSCNKVTEEEIQKNVPSLEEVSGIWVSADTVDMEPSLRNFCGQALVNRDMTSVSWIASAPYSGGYHTGVLKINGKTPRATMFRWLPHQAIRKGEVDSWKVFSTVKMVPGENGILWQVIISNGDTVSREMDISLDMIGFISKYGGDWQWWYPYPKLDGKTTVRDDEVENVRKHIGSDINHSTEQVVELINGKPTQTNKIAKWPSDKDILNAEKYGTKIKDDILLIYDNETEARTAFKIIGKPDSIILRNSGGTAEWKQMLNPGESYSISYLMTYGDEDSELQANIQNWSADFDSVYTNVDRIWEDRWQEIFKPENDFISGTFPVLETDDKKAKKVYYTGPLTLLYLTNTYLPGHDKIFLTGGPRWGASITFFWDITEWSTLWAVIDPDMMKDQLTSWILIDPSKYYGKDNFGGNGVGNGYSANYWALFRMIRAYVTISRDFDFLDKEIEGKTVLQHLDNYAQNWKKLAPYGKKGFMDEDYKLADFGDDEWNLLECVPTYKHIVPSFNAGYAWMIRELADFYDYKGNNRKADTLRSEADDMIGRILDLYAGNGVWNSLYPERKKVEVRHCLDFMFIGRYIPEDVPEEIKQEMIDFLYRELITDHWMRAQSLLDIAAKNSDRPDHGPLGAFDGWPAGTMDALTQFGYPDSALKFYHAIEPATYEGCWAQAHELWGENKFNKNARVRIAQRGWHNRESSGGISISQVMLKDFFGFYPDIDGQVLTVNTPGKFSGNLYHVLYGGEYYTLNSQNGKVKMKKE